MGVNESSILNKLDEYFKSKECEEKIQSTISMYLKKGVSTTNAGSKVVDEKWMMTVAEMLRDNILRIASGHNLPESVMRDMNSLACMPPIRDGDYVRIDLVFKNDLSRESLYPDGYNDDNKLKNIIALFNSGYEADGVVHGWWDNHKYDSSKDKSGEALLKTGNVQNSVFISSLPQREGLGFMQEAISDFLKSIGGDVDVTVSINEIYDI